MRDEGCDASMKMLVLSERNIESDEKMGGPPNIGLVSDASKKRFNGGARDKFISEHDGIEVLRVVLHR